MYLIEELEKLLSVLNIGKKFFLLTGDFNLNLLHFDSRPIPVNNFYNMLMCHGLTLAITKPTRVTEFSATLLDHIYTLILSDIYLLSLFCMMILRIYLNLLI